MPRDQTPITAVPERFLHRTGLGMPFKQWVYLQAQIRGCSPSNIYNRLHQGRMPKPVMMRKNQRVMWVLFPNASL